MRLVSFAAALLAAAAVAAPASAQALQATLHATGFSQPVGAVSPPGDLQRLFIVEQSGRIRIIKNGVTLATPFLHVGSVASGGLGLISTGSERGLLGLAFHPDYANNGYFYINYTASGSGATVVARYTVSANPDVANTASAQVIISVAQPASNHNGGCIQFGPDGKLYIGMGDGGGANDTSNNAQTVSTLLGKMLRLDVDIPAPHIPSDNPFFGSATTRQEIWHLGLRNPWRFSFDRQTGDMYIGDVGQNAWEEISFQPAGVGGLNYGWRCMEANNCTGLTGCTCNSPALTGAIHQYGHGLGCSVSGGYVYRGSQICGLDGTYFFGDYCSSRIWSFKYVNGTVTDFTERTNELEPVGTPTISQISSFGEDAAGELYILDYADGEIYKLELAGGQADCNANGVPDACDIAAGTALDCNANGVPDSCDIAAGTSQDCNANGIPDSCDIASGFSQDVNGNGLPDECECPGGTPPSVYCTAKINSQLCSPAIAISAAPSASNAGNCLVTGSQFLNNRNGLMFYGYQTTANPFQGGFMCVQAPVRRTGVQNAGGSTGGTDCSGTYSFDLNAYIASGADPLLQVVGQTFACQWWSRDAADQFGSSFSNAVQGQICQ